MRRCVTSAKWRQDQPAWWVVSQHLHHSVTVRCYCLRPGRFPTSTEGERVPTRRDRAQSVAKTRPAGHLLTLALRSSRSSSKRAPAVALLEVQGWRRQRGAHKCARELGCRLSRSWLPRELWPAKAGRLASDREPPKKPTYPEFLLLSKAVEDTTLADLLDVTVTSHAEPFATKVASFNKKLPVPKVNYPSVKGSFPRTLALGVFTGQLHRFSRTCVLTPDFVNSAVEVARLLTTKGYSQRKLVQYFLQFVSSKYPSANTPKAAVCHRLENTTTNYHHPAR